MSADSYYRNYMYHPHVHVGAILYHCAKDSETCKPRQFGKSEENKMLLVLFEDYHGFT